MERKVKAFGSWVKHGKIRSAVWTAISCAGGDILMPDGLRTKTGSPVMEVLAENHSQLMDPVPCIDGRGAFEPYAKTPCLFPLRCNQALVEKVAGKLGGSAGSSGMDAYAFSNLLLWHDQVLKGLREEVAL